MAPSGDIPRNDQSAVAKGDGATAVNVAQYGTATIYQNIVRLTHAELEVVADRIAGKAGRPDKDAETDDCPYPGLEAFQPSQAKYFAGRDEEIAGLAAALDRYPVAASIAASGAGKSSLVNAGLIPALGAREGEAWDIFAFRPGREPLKALSRAISGVLEPDAAHDARLGVTNQRVAKLRSGEVPLRDHVEILRSARTGAAAGKRKHVLFFIDQWEELYTQPDTEADRAVLIRELLDISERGLAKVLLTMRADFMGELLSDNTEFLHRVKPGICYLEKMTEITLRAAIRKPAERVGLTVPEGLVSRLVADSRTTSGEVEPGALPYLQFGLRRLWEQRDRAKNSLTTDAYDRMHGLKGAIGAHASAVYNDLTKEEQRLAARIIPRLVNVSGTNPDTSRRLPFADFDEEARALLRKLAEPDKRLIVLSTTPDTTDEGEILAEIAHEALLRDWTELTTWIADRGEFFRLRNRLEADAKVWIESGQNTAFLTLRGKALLDAREVVAKAESNEISQNLKSFVDGCAKRKRRFLYSLAASAAAVFATIWFGLYYYSTLDEEFRTLAAVEAGSRAQIALQKSEEFLEDGYPEGALAAGLIAVDAISPVAPHSPILDGAVAAISQSLADSTFLYALRVGRGAALRVVAADGSSSAIVVTSDGASSKIGKQNLQSIATLSTREIGVSSYSISSQGNLAAWGSDAGLVSVWNLDKPDLSRSDLEFGQLPERIAISDNNSMVAAIGLKGSVKVWNAETGEILWTKQTELSLPSTLKFCPLGGCLIVGTKTGMLAKLIFEPRDVAETLAVGDRIISAAFGADERLIFTTGSGSVWIGSAQNWKAATEVGHHNGFVTSLDVSVDGRFAATTGSDGIAKVWDIVKERFAWEVTSERTVAISTGKLSPDAQDIAIAYGGGDLSVWSSFHDKSRPRQVLEMRGHTGSVVDLDFSRDGKTLLSASLDGTVRFWQLESAKWPRKLRANQGRTILESSRDGLFVAGASVERESLDIWGSRGLDALNSIPISSPPNAIALLSRAQRALIGTSDGRLLSWKPSQVSPKVIQPGIGSVAAIAVSSDEALAAAIGVGGKIVVCDLRSDAEKCDSRNLPRGQWGYSVAFDEKRRFLGVTSGVESNNGVLTLWDLLQNELRHIEGHTDRVSSIEFDDARSRVLTTSWDGSARIWSIETGKELVRILHPPGRLQSSGFSTDGNHVVTLSNDRILRIWNIPDTQIKSPDTLILREKDSLILSKNMELFGLKIDQSRSLIAASTASGDVHVWHFPSGTRRAILRGDGSQIAFDFTSKAVIGATRNGAILRWPIRFHMRLDNASIVEFARNANPIIASVDSSIAQIIKVGDQDLSQCPFTSGAYLGLPPYSLVNSLRARKLLIIPARCSDEELPAGQSRLVEAFISQASGDFSAAQQAFSELAEDDVAHSYLGLGDLAFFDAIGSRNYRKAMKYYRMALSVNENRAHARIGWLRLQAEVPDIEAIRSDFRRGAASGDPDAFAGLGWLSEKYGSSLEDIESALVNYASSQKGYARNGATEFAAQVAERRAMLAYLLGSASQRIFSESTDYGSILFEMTGGEMQ